MRTLTDVFAAGTTALPEGLRTLQVSPHRYVEPGQTVHATFAFRNLGGGTATGFRVRFRIPEGLTYLVGTARIDETPVDELGGLTTLLQGAGADIGEIAPGGERRISLAYSVASTIEDGTPIAIQAAIASFEVPVIGSNVVRLVVRSKPLLNNPRTTLAVTPVRETVPGEELQVRALIHNAGESSAHDVIALLPAPANTTYVERSARVDGREPVGLSDVEPFGIGRPTIVASTLAPGATIEVVYRARIDAVVEDKTQVVVRGGICSLELAEFALEPVTLKIPSVPSFAGEETAFVAHCDDEVSPGERVRVALRLCNVGTACAHKVRAKIVLPDGMAYCAGSRTVDDAIAPDGEEPGAFVLGELEPGRTVELALWGVVQAPLSNGTELVLGARIDWQKGHRTFDRTLTVRSAPAFPAAFNCVRRESARRLAPGDAAAFTIAVANFGTDVASSVRVVLDADRGLEQLRAFESDAEVAIGDNGAIYLENLQPGILRTLRIDAKLAGALEDQSQLRLRATLRVANLEPLELGAAVHQIASRPRFSAETSQIVAENDEVLRPNRITACKLVLRNEGTDRGRDVRVRLQLPEELRLDRAEGAARDGDTVVLGEIPAGEMRESTIFLRLAGPVAQNETLEVLARGSGLNVVPFSLAPLKLGTHAEASFAEGATLASYPADAIDAGAPVLYTLALRNCGDGAAKRLTIRLDPPSNAIYAPGSTAVNGVPLLDFVGTSPLLSSGGLTLGDVGVGAEVFVRIQAIVNTPLPTGTAIETRAHIAWDDRAETIVRAEPLRVRSAPALPIVEAGLPFTVIDAAAAPARAATPVAVELPPAIPVNGSGHARNGHALPLANEPAQLPPGIPVNGNGHARNGHALPISALASEPAQLPPAIPVNGNGLARNGNAPAIPALASEPAQVEATPADEPTILSLWLNDEKLDWTVRYLEEARLGGLVPDLLLLRALFPDDAAGADAGTRRHLREHAERLSELTDRLFLKLRLPDPEIVADDLETATLRKSLRDVVGAIRALPVAAPYEANGLRLTSALYPEELASTDAALVEAPLVTAEPWLATALLLGSTLEYDDRVVGGIGGYRAALRRELAALRDLDPDAFREAVLFRPVDPQLDESRAQVLRSLAAHREAAR
jgi:uncharacterized repeat protein (TIGR01451 family)